MSLHTYCQNAWYLAGRAEFAEFLPANVSCAIIAPIGTQGVAIFGGDTQRGFSPIDQAWISSVCDKLDDTLQLTHREEAQSSV
jgi:hypothetical protein